MTILFTTNPDIQTQMYQEEAEKFILENIYNGDVEAMESDDFDDWNYYGIIREISESDQEKAIAALEKWFTAQTFVLHPTGTVIDYEDVWDRWYPKEWKTFKEQWLEDFGGYDVTVSIYGNHLEIIHHYANDDMYYEFYPIHLDDMTAFRLYNTLHYLENELIEDVENLTESDVWESIVMDCIDTQTPISIDGFNYRFSRH